MKIDVYNPLAEFAVKEDVWVWIQDYSDEDEYGDLDAILGFLNDERERSELPDSIRSMTGEELRKEYARRFPIMLGKAFQLIGKDFETQKIEMEIDFSSLRCHID